jgi:dTDP-4-dehydrorhamnose reductase
MSKIIVLGANGQLGQTFEVASDDYKKHDFKFLTSADTDITDTALTADKLNELEFDILINCAAYTAVDKAEEEKETAYEVNTKAVENIAKICNQKQAILVHYSTDYVYSGQSYKPYSEYDKTHPVNYYGQTKLNGENLAINNNPKTFVIRTSWVYSPFGKNFAKTMLRLFDKKDSLKVVADQIGTPTYTFDLVDATFNLLESQEYGVYNFSNEGVCSWYDFATSIAEVFEKDIPISPIKTEQYPTPAKRPFYSVLDKSKYKNTTGKTVPYWRDSLKQFKAKYDQ